MAAVILRRVKKIYSNGFRAVHGIDFDINDGEFMVSAGPSGYAKSTTLRIIASLENVSGDRIYISDRLVNTPPPKNRSITMVFQSYVLYSHKTAFDNMASDLKIQKKPEEEIKRIAEEVAEKLEISGLLYRRPKEMSGSQCRCIAVGHAIVRKPDVFLFGEPLSNLNTKLRVLMRVKIAQLYRSLKNESHPATMIYVTYDQIEVLTLGDRICVPNQGQIMQIDTPANLYNHPASRFVAGSIGSPSMNLIDAVVCEEDGKPYIDIAKDIRLYIPENKQSVLRAYVNKPVCFGICPEHISLSLNCKEMNTVIGALSIIEGMGSEKYLYFTINNKEFIAKADDQSITTADIGKDLYFNPDTSFCHTFDFHTEENLANYL